jgi:hypothetical protein
LLKAFFSCRRRLRGGGPLLFAPGIAAEIRSKCRRAALAQIGAESPAGFFIGNAGKKSLGARKNNRVFPVVLFFKMDYSDAI